MLDDSAEPHDDLSGNELDDVSYEWEAARMRLGAKRNRLNQMALSWGADVICAMDDDDWYGPNYVAGMVELLRDSVEPFAGSSSNYCYEVSSGRILLVSAAPPMSSGNGVLCYRAEVLKTTRYPDLAISGEDRIFLGERRVLQHPDIAQVHLALLHGHNTEDKTSLTQTGQVQTSMSLASFPMRAEDMDFYRSLTKALS